MKKLSVLRGGAALFIAAALVACSSGGFAPVSGVRQATTPAHKGGVRRPMFWNLGQTQQIATGSMLIPLSLTVNGSSGQIAVFGATNCAAASGPNPCPNINFSATPPQYYRAFNVSFTLPAVTLNANCSAPTGTPTPAPGFAAACYVVAYEGGVGPYVLQGPATSSNGTISFAAESATLNLESQVPYNVFLAYVTSLSSPPPTPSPSPVPSPTYFATEPPPATPTPTATPTPVVTIAPSPCATATSGDDEGDDDGGDDGDGSCSSPAPKPSPTCANDDGGDGGHHHHHRRDVRHHHKHHGGDDDCEDS